jgi:hypothetical protein
MPHIHSPHRLRAQAPTLALALLGLAYAGAAASGNLSLLSGTNDGGVCQCWHLPGWLLCTK